MMIEKPGLPGWPLPSVSLPSAGLATTHWPKIAVFTKNLTNPAYEAFRVGADKVAKAANALTFHFVPKKPDDVVEQSAQVEQVLNDRPDVILFTPVDDQAMIEPVKKLNAANIPVVLFTNPMPGKFVTYIGADDVDLGYKQAKYLFSKMEGQGRIVVVEGVAGAPTNRDRLSGYQRAFIEFPGIQLVGSAIGNYQRAGGQAAMTELLEEQLEFDAVLVTNDAMALGVLDALEVAGRTAAIISINGTLDAVKQVEAGAIVATVVFDTFKMGCLATEAAMRHLKGQPVPERIILPTEIVDEMNYESWLIPLNQRTCPIWEDIVR